MKQIPISINFIKDPNSASSYQWLSENKKIALPSEYIPYSLILREYESHYYPNLFTETPDIKVEKNGKTKTFKNQWAAFNKRIDKLRLVNRPEYLKIIQQDDRINEAEKIRQVARQNLNRILSTGTIKTYKFHANNGLFEDLSKNWWLSLQSMNIDYDSGLLEPMENGYKFNGELILLDKKKAHKILFETPKEPPSEEEIIQFDQAIRNACIECDCVINRDNYHKYFKELYGKRIKDSLLKNLMIGLPSNIKNSGRRKKDANPYLTFEQLKKYIK